jgi:hypothetical protein
MLRRWVSRTVRARMLRGNEPPVRTSGDAMTSRHEGTKPRRHIVVAARGIGFAVLSCTAALTGCPMDDRLVELSESGALRPGEGPGSAGTNDGGLVPNDNGSLPNAVAPVDIGVPELVVSAESFDWGRLPAGLAGTKGLSISNAGNGVMSRPLVSLSEPIDPAFSILLNRCERELQPGEDCEVRIQFMPTTAVASQATLLVDAGEAGSSMVALDGIGLGTGTLLLSPTAESSAEFGQVAVGGSLTQSFTLFNPGEAPSGLLEFFVNSPEFALATPTAEGCVSGQTDLLPATSCNIDVTFTPASRGRADASLVVESEGLGATGINLSAEGLGVGELGATTEVLDFQGVVRGAVALAELQLENVGDLPLPLGPGEISGPNAADFSISESTCGELLDGGATCLVQVQFAPNDLGPRSASLLVSAGDAPHEFSLSGLGLQPGSLVLMPSANSTADFSAVLVNQSRVQTFTLQNPGAQPSGALLSISAGNDFVPLPPSQPADCQVGTTSLVNGESCTISVSFQPTLRISRQASLRVDSPLTGPVALQLSGRGILPAQVVSLTGVLDFGDVVRAQTASGTVIVTNEGDQPLPPPVLTLEGQRSEAFTLASRCTAPLDPAARCEIAVTFQPTEAVRYAVTLQLNGGVGGTTSVPLRANVVQPGSLVLAPAANNSGQFGDVGVDVERIQTFTVTNPGGVASGPLAITVVNNDTSASFSRVAPAGNDCNDRSSLINGESCTVRVRFFPRTNLSFGATLRASSPAAGIQNLSLGGRGVRAAVLNRSESRDFGSRAIGDSSSPASFTRSWTVTNGGDVASAVPMLTPTNPGEFVVAANGCSAALAPTASCTLSIEFKPSAVGRRTGQITLAAGTTALVVLTMSGTGFQRSGPGGTCNTAADCQGGANALACGNGANGARICCESACQGTCEFCNAQGQCVARQGGEACSANDPRRGCFGRNRCLLPNGQSCSGDNANCGSGNCETAIGGGASVCCGANCSAGEVCNPQGQCVSNLSAPGAACTTNGQCQSGVCTGGFCCAAGPCTGPCATCQQGTGACVAAAPRTPCGPAGSHLICIGGTCTLPSVRCAGVNRQVTSTMACCESRDIIGTATETFTSLSACPPEGIDNGLATTPITCDEPTDCPTGELCCLHNDTESSSVSCVAAANCTEFATQEVCSSPAGGTGSCQIGTCQNYVFEGFVPGWQFCNP